MLLKEFVLKALWLNLYKGPCCLALFGLLFIFVSGSVVPVVLEDVFSLFVLVEASKEFGPLIGALLYFLAVAWGGYNYFRYWKWRQGKGDTCRTCGMLAEQKRNKRGVYYQCLSCGNHQFF